MNLIVKSLIAGWHALVCPIVFIFRGGRRTLVTLWPLWRGVALVWGTWGVTFILGWRDRIFPFYHCARTFPINFRLRRRLRRMLKLIWCFLVMIRFCLIRWVWDLSFFHYQTPLIRIIIVYGLLRKAMRLWLINSVGLWLILLHFRSDRLSKSTFITQLRSRMMGKLAIYMIHGFQRRTHHMITMHGLVLIGLLLPVLIVHFISIDELWPRSHDHPWGNSDGAHAIIIAFIWPSTPCGVLRFSTSLLTHHPISGVHLLQLSLYLWIQPWMINQVSDPLRDGLTLFAE